MESVLDANVKFTGTILTQEDLRVEGALEGAIESDANVTVAECGRVRGDIKARSVQVAGTVEGNVRAVDHLVLARTGRILGDVHAGHIRVEEGGALQGRVLTESAPEPAT